MNVFVVFVYAKCKREELIALADTKRAIDWKMGKIANLNEIKMHAVIRMMAMNLTSPLLLHLYIYTFDMPTNPFQFMATDKSELFFYSCLPCRISRLWSFAF